MSEREPWCDARQRAAWVRDWWTNSRWLGAKGAVPEVRNLCDDVDALIDVIERLQARCGVLASFARPEDIEAAELHMTALGLLDSAAEAKHANSQASPVDRGAE